MTDETGRRDLLRAGGGLATTAAIGGLGGCLGVLGRNEGDDGDGGDDSPSATAAEAYAPWVYDPGTIDEQDHYGFQYVNLNAYVNAKDHFADATYQQISQQYQRKTLFLAGGLSIEDVDWHIDLDATGQGRRAVLRGEFDAAAVLAGFEESDDYETGETYQGYELVSVGGDQSATIAIGANAIAFDAGQRPGENVRTMIDAGGSDGSGYVDASADMAELFGHLTPADQVYAGTRDAVGSDEASIPDGNLEGQVGLGTAGTFEDDVMRTRYALCFDSADALDLEAVRQWIDENSDDGERFGDVYDVSARDEGRSAVVTGTIDVADR